MSPSDTKAGGTNGPTKYRGLGASVTRLGEFSPILRLLTLGIFLNYGRAHILGYPFPRVKLCRYGLGHILGIFFTNSSGHPACLERACCQARHQKNAVYIKEEKIQ
jgi:hypothetical protein